MATFNLRQVLGREKPHSSVTDWVEIMTGTTTAAESYEGIFELVEAINLQASGPAEATRALRKKLKHGNPHHQYRALVIMRALLENIPKKMGPAFADSQFIGILRGIWTDANVDKRVKKRLDATLLGWQVAYRHDPDMVLYEGLHRSFKNDRSAYRREEIMTHLGVPEANLDGKSSENKDKEKNKTKKRRKYSKRDEMITHLGIPSEYDVQITTGEESSETKERNKAKAEDRAKRGRNQLERRKRSFNFERDKPKVLDSIVEATQASSSLLNAIMLVNLDNDTFESNERVQTCLKKAKEAKKRIAWFTQLVENEDIIGTLIETHERVEAALDAYERLTTEDVSDPITTELAKTSIRDQEPAETETQADQNGGAGKAKELGDKSRAKESFDSYVHPDLADLDFGASAKNLPPPLKPSTPNANDSGRDEDTHRGSLSDFSDYESSDDGDTFVGSSKRRDFVTVSDNEDSDEDQAGPSSQVQPSTSQSSQPTTSSNPFDDIFGDDEAVGHGR